MSEGNERGKGDKRSTKEAKVGLLYRGYYRNIIKELKAVMEHRP